MRLVSLLALALLPSIPVMAHAQSATHPFHVEDMQRLLRVGEAVLSPDGKWIAYSIQASDVTKNKSVTNLWLISSGGGSPTQLTFADTGANSTARWSPDSKSLYFLSTRDEGTPQIFLLSTAAAGEAKQITHIAVGVNSFLLSPDGKTIAITASVFPECKDLACNARRKKEEKDNPVKVRTITTLPFRRWDQWNDGKRNHIFVVPAEGGEATDITPGDVDSPIWTESGSEEVAFSPDSKEICFSRYTENEALTANSDLYVIPVAGGQPRAITKSKGTDTTPLYSPDGRYIAYLATLRPNAATDATRLFLYDRQTGETRNLTEPLDRSVASAVWSQSSKSLYISFEDRGSVPVARLDLADTKVSKIVPDGVSGNIQVSKDGSFVVFTNMTFSQPNEVFRMELSRETKPVQLTFENRDVLKDIQFGEYSSFTFRGAKGDMVQCWQIKPPNFDASKKYPLVLLMHGGPENAWDNLFHYRWNFQLFAAAGYVVIAPNFHGSSGFGLKYMDAIKGDWGGAPYEDQMKAVDAALTWPFVDSTRLGAAGASYGGYMANWIEGHTDRFRAIVSHDGLFDILTMFYSSDLVGGIDAEFKGTPWKNQQALIDVAPATYAKNFRTPMLIIHGERDYRVDPSQGYAMFQVLQAMHIPSKLLVFEEENHWVLKPADNILWYHSVLDWLDHWMKPDKTEWRGMLKPESTQ
jgi:dipeptidyl aminopeptidase/acylaminoacyl peptidase